MRRTAVLALFALAIGIVLPGSALPAAGGSDLPAKATASGYTTANLATGEMHFVSTGQASHFGAITMEQHGQLVPTGAGTFNYSGTWTMTAANGDQMSGTATGTARFTDATHSIAVVTYTSSGGTGRFADATLVAVAIVESTRISVDGVITNSFHEGTLVGELSY